MHMYMQIPTHHLAKYVRLSNACDSLSVNLKKDHLHIHVPLSLQSLSGSESTALAQLPSFFRPNVVQSLLQEIEPCGFEPCWRTPGDRGKYRRKCNITSMTKLARQSQEW